MEKTVQKIPFLRLAIALAIGIVAANFNLAGGRFILAVAILLAALLVFVNKNYSYGRGLLYGAGIHVILILLGIYSYQQYNRKPVFYEQGKFLGVVLEVPQEKANSYKSLLRIVAFNPADSVIATHEKVMVYFEKSKKAEGLQAGEIILFDQTPQMLQNNGNPGEFDYKRYLGLKKIYRQVYLRENSWHKTGNTAHSVHTLAETYREKLLSIYRSQPIDKTELEILSALTLGYKRDLDPETKRVFSSAGAMHILAVSGLHVGVVWGLLSLVFGFLKKYQTGRIIFVAGTILTLWGYAFVTGLSPSVMRATAMFTIVIIGDNLNRKANIYNSLAASAFFLLLVNPNNLFNMGFQLSYCAVFGIVFLQPKLEKLIKVKNKVVRYFWVLLTVSVAAQISTSPLSVFYFGQLPAFFWISNTVAIPAVMILIPEGIALLVFAKIPLLSTFISFTLNLLLRFVYVFLEFVEQLPGSVIPVQINSFQLLLLAVAMFSIFIFLNNQRYIYAKAALGLVFLFSVSGLPGKIRQIKKNEMIVYNHSGFAVVHLFSNKTNYVISEQHIASEAYIHRSILETKQRRRGKAPVFLTLQDTAAHHLLLKSGYLFFEGKTISFHPNRHEATNTLAPDFIINPSSLKHKIRRPKKPVLIVTGAKVAKQIDSDSLEIHHTYKNGAFIEKW